eukprot:TRINITY_DN6518_c0_g1_i1.p1 TRINITY_DN6518_c0_g1~~TRINITY_DN6518_c0_g1_i1.p1  ORF type:complete len:539 (+),score=89.77 TRINITY_DN6518_c0_g1_i1:1415-3031(+)
MHKIREKLQETPEAYANDMFHPDRKLVGLASFDRIHQVLEYLLLTRSFNDRTDDEIKSWARSGLSGKFDAERAVIQLVKSQMEGCRGGITFFTTVLRHLCDRYSVIARDLMIQESVVTESNDFFVEFYTQLQVVFMERVQEILSQLRDRWLQSIDLYAYHVPIDMPTKTLMFMLNCPMESIIMDERSRKAPSTFKLRPDAAARAAEKGATIPSWAASEQKAFEVVSHLIQQLQLVFTKAQATDGEEGTSPHTAVLEFLSQQLAVMLDVDPRLKIIRKSINMAFGLFFAKDFSGLRSCITQMMTNRLSQLGLIEDEAPDNDASSQARYNARAVAKMNKLKEFRSVMSAGSGLFNEADIVEGDFAVISQAPASFIDLQYVRSVAVEYYLLLLTRFMFDAAAAYGMYFREQFGSGPDVGAELCQYMHNRLKASVSPNEDGPGNGEAQSKFDQLLQAREEVRQQLLEKRTRLNEDIEDIKAALRQTVALRPISGRTRISMERSRLQGKLPDHSTLTARALTPSTPMDEDGEGFHDAQGFDTE